MDERVIALLCADQMRWGPLRWDGRGARFPQLRAQPGPTGRPQCSRFLTQPLPAAVAMATVRMLTQAGDRATASQYVRHATDYYNQQIFNLRRQLAREHDAASRGRLVDDIAHMAAVERRHQWRHVLQATLRVALTDPALTRNERDLIDLNASAAETRVRNLVDRWKGSIPTGLVPVSGPRLRKPPAAWTGDANRLLAGDGQPGDLELACGMYFMYLWHALGGLIQFDLTDVSAWHNPEIWWRRTHAAARLLNVLRHSCTANAADDFSVRRTAGLIVVGLFKLPYFTPTFDPPTTSRLEALRRSLPPEFGNYFGGYAPHLEQCAAWLPSAIAKRRLRMLHHVAEMVLDMLNDTLKVRVGLDEMGGVPGFDLDCYTYFHSQGHGRNIEQEADARAHVLETAPPGTAVAVDPQHQAGIKDYLQATETRFSHFKHPQYLIKVWATVPPFPEPIPANPAAGTACAWCRVCRVRKES